MSPEQRREMIIKTALPLIGEYGAAVTTSKIASAAGIGEATIFRVFADKEELLDACMAEALCPDHAIRELASIPLDQPLADRLTDAVEALQAHGARMGAVAGALHASGRLRRGAPGTAPGLSREASMASIAGAVADLLEPDKDGLRLPAEQIASVFLGLLLARARGDGEPRLAVRDLVQVFLHGALTTTAEPE